jgi:oligosaccharide repeat unit polymerase
MFEWTLSLLISVLILGNAFFYKFYVRTYINPVSLFSLFWFLFVFIPILVYPNGSVSFLAVFYIYGFVLSFSLPFYFISGRRAFCVDVVTADFQKKVFVFVLLGFFVSVFSFLLHLYNNGYWITDWISSPFSITANLVRRKYSGELIHGFHSKFSVLLMYPISFFAGLIFSKIQKGKAFLIFSAFTVPLAYFLVFGDKGALFLVIFLFYTGWLVSRSMVGKTTLLDSHYFPKLLLGAALLLILIIMAFVARGSGLSFREMLDFLYRSIVSYSSGHIFSFSDWFNSYLGIDSLMNYQVQKYPIGYYSFASIYDLLGYPSLFPHGGVYDEFYTDGFIKTNIYTVFRGLILDFGIFLSLVFAFFFGSLVAFSYRILRYSKKYFIMGLAGWYLFSLFTYSSYIISTFIWLSTTVSVFVVLVLGFVFKLRWYK